LIAVASLFPLIIAKSKKAEGKSPEALEKESLNITLDLEDKNYAVLKKTGGAAYVQTEGEGRPVIVYRVSEKKLLHILLGVLIWAV